MNRSTLWTLSLLAVPLGIWGGVTSAAAQGQDLGDPEIAHIAVTANALDVEAARLALERAEDEAVREFARTMIRDHEGVIEQAEALAGRLGVTPRDNATSRTLSAGAEDPQGAILPGRRLLRSRLHRRGDRVPRVRDLRRPEELGPFDRERRAPLLSRGRHSRIGSAPGTRPAHRGQGIRPLRRRALRAVAPGCVLLLLPFAAACGGEGSGGEASRDEEVTQAKPRTHRIEIRAMRYRPVRLDVAPGDTVIWVNQDIVRHTVTAENGSWDSGSMAQGERWRLVVGPEGSVDYACDFHPTMEGRLGRGVRPRTHGGM